MQPSISVSLLAFVVFSCGDVAVGVRLCVSIVTNALDAFGEPLLVLQLYQ
jgi:hypothetical protein